jgi:hypothetical protein
MPHATLWSPAADSAIRSMRGAGASYDTICAALGLCRWTVRERARHIGAKFAAPVVREAEAAGDIDRAPFPPGHPTTWGAITADTCLAGSAYPR